ncbi:putative mucin TcMUCII [Trypanosoma cruzi]|nr:putative mucin TcMUCII [Trypanosoma cruzi]
MMTCRLLCALLVLALCCCPSVGATGSEDTTVEVGQGPTPQDSGSSSDSQITGAKVTEDNGQSSDMEPNLSERQSTTASAPATPTSTGTEEGPSELPTSQDGKGATAQPEASEVNSLSPGSTGDSDKSDVNNPEHNNELALVGKEVKEQAPTTTTTTTTTTTMAPTTTTTRAPSRLREIDGSLSSSAWVCAPLLLAASALAYTTLG